MRNIDRIPKAIIDLERQERPNISTTTKKYDVTRKILKDRWKGKSVSMIEDRSTNRQYLSNVEEKALIHIINKLTDRRMPPTSTIIKNLVEEIRGATIGKN